MGLEVLEKGLGVVVCFALLCFALVWWMLSVSGRNALIQCLQVLCLCPTLSVPFCSKAEEEEVGELGFSLDLLACSYSIN